MRGHAAYGKICYINARHLLPVRDTGYTGENVADIALNMHRFGT